MLIVSRRIRIDSVDEGDHLNETKKRTSRLKARGYWTHGSPQGHEVIHRKYFTARKMTITNIAIGAAISDATVAVVARDAVVGLW